MNLIKNLFSKLFVPKSNMETETTPEQKDDSLLKEAARNAVVHALQNEDTVLDPHVRKMLEEYNKNFFDAFRISKENYQVRIEKKCIIVEVNDKDFEEMLSKSDKLSISYEHIFLRIVQREVKNFEYRLFLRAGNSFQKHQDSIMRTARKLALRVKKTGHKITIPSKSSYERSLIHGVVEKIPGVATKSVGPVHQRRLVIYSLRNPSQNSTDSNSQTADE